MFIVLSEKNRDRITAAIEEAQKKARIRLIDTCDIFNYAEQVEKTCCNISKKNLEGTRAYIDKHAQTFPGAYKGIPESTQFGLLFSAGTWKLTGIARGRTLGSTQEIRIKLSESAKDAIIKKIENLG